MLLPMEVIEAARAGDPSALEHILQYYDHYINKICTRTIYDKESLPRIGIDEYMKHRLQAKLVDAIVVKKIAKSKEAVKGRDERFAPLTASSVFAVW